MHDNITLGLCVEIYYDSEKRTIFGRCPKNTDIVKVEYHSPAWNMLVEQGYITWTVENGIAKMVK